MQDRSCYPLNRSRARYLGSTEGITLLTLISFSDDRITFSYLYKRTAMAGNRTLDLDSRGPAWSHGAAEAFGM